MKVTIPIPQAMTNGRQLAIEFDSDNINFVNLHHFFTDDGCGGKVPTGGTELKLEFRSREGGPMWVEYNG